ncbi:putative Peptidyl-prolyl cis-trans isomerase [uncultured Paludibacter sp.]|nr:putative Peptidyl-prolyl cis-trans isomerase [uncultured Paludibacter sp.]
MKSKIFYIASILFLLYSCVKPSPQSPANKENKVDSTNINLRTMNEMLAQKEDSIIQEIINRQTVSFNKTTSGIWYYKENETTLDSLKNSSSVSFAYECYSLEGDYIKSQKIKTNFGKKEIPAGLEEGLTLMRKGEKMRLIVPWYLAYGMKGKDNIPPYTSLMYEITIDK